ncbi:MAG: IclR family transcriptional regulator [Comamonas sp.]
MGRTTNIDFSEGAASNRYVTALSRGLKILASWRENDSWLTNSEISIRTGLPKPTVARMTYTLCADGYLKYSRQSGKYSPGNSMYIMGINFLTGIKVRKIARPYMQELADQFKASVSMGINDGLSMVYIENCHSDSPLTLGLDVGARLPLAKTAMGHSYLFTLPEKDQSKLMIDFENFYGEEWIKIQEGMEISRNQWKKLGFTTIVREWQGDISGIGATLVLNDGLRYSFNVGGLATALSKEHLVNDVGPRLIRMINILDSLARS